MHSHSTAAMDTLAQLKAGKLVGTKHIKINAGLTSFPTALYTLADTLEILDLTGNALSELPDDLTRFKQLRVLFCSSNQFKHLPEVLGECPQLSMVGFKANQIAHIAEHAIPTQNLRWFIVTDNQLTRIPDRLGDCAKLQKLMLAGNQLTTLPIGLANCHALELLRISANRFESLPDFLLDLPKLTWLAYAGNPCSEKDERALWLKHAAQHIDWKSLVLSEMLGQGASGVTYQAQLQLARHTEPVAVKLFKAEMTSDGLPRSEMLANCVAGNHPHLVGIKGIVSEHPQQVLGQVMPLLPADLQILAGPPSFESCTRDVYPQDFRLTEAQALHILQGVSDGLLHLHERGLLHGDLYAHNILWNSQQVVLSDLGGASLLPLNQPIMANRLRQLDMRALEVLTAELAECAGVTVEQLKQGLHSRSATP